ncbi:MAG TPA: ArsR family transcriptional regulator [Longimicrobium sp.]|jgi:predicted ArsR family transcriptional regulator
MNGSRREILVLLCAANRRVGELADALGISESAVRVHLHALEVDGLVQHETLRGGVGKPAHEYRLTPAGEALLSRAYLPFLLRVLEGVRSRLDPEETERLLRAAGSGLAPPDRPRGSARARAEEAVRLLGDLGGAGYVEEGGAELVIRGRCCPLAAIVPEHPLACTALEATLTEFTGLPVRADCDVRGRPSCRFRIRSQPTTG